MSAVLATPRVLPDPIRIVVSGSTDAEIVEWLVANPGQLPALFSAAERRRMFAILSGAIPLTDEQRAKRHSRPLHEAVRGAVADFVRDRLANGDHAKALEIAPPALPARTADDLIAAAVAAGRISSITITADSAADLDERAAQFAAAGATTMTPARDYGEGPTRHRAAEVYVDRADGSTMYVTIATRIGGGS